MGNKPSKQGEIDVSKLVKTGFKKEGDYSLYYLSI